jgi:acyl-CoA synthetase (NDP forming)
MTLDFQPLPPGKRAVILTNAGGPAALASDSLSANGFVLEDLQEDTRCHLREHLTPAAQVSNPVDMLGGAEAQDYGMAVERLLMDETVDIILPILVPQALVNPADIAQAIVDAAKQANRPVVTCILGDQSIDEARIVLQGIRMPLFVYPESLGVVLKACETMRIGVRKKSPLCENYRALKYLKPRECYKYRKAKSLRRIRNAAGSCCLWYSVIKGGLAKSPVAAAAGWRDQVSGGNEDRFGADSAQIGYGRHQTRFAE